MQVADDAQVGDTVVRDVISRKRRFWTRIFRFSC